VDGIFAEHESCNDFIVINIKVRSLVCYC